MKLSIVIPIYNAKIFLENLIASLMVTTKSDFELILLDDFSDTPTRNFVDQLDSPDVKIQKILNVEHKWTNYNWNLGTLLSMGEYIAVLNSDILVNDGWDLPLIELLNECTIACPMTIKKNDDKTFLQDLHPLVKQIDPKMINGAAFMFHKSDRDALFPIPPDLKHWCGDNWIADRANELGGVKFSKESLIKHGVSVSANTLRPFEYKTRILQDLEAYEHISDRSMKLIKDTIHL